MAALHSRTRRLPSVAAGRTSGDAALVVRGGVAVAALADLGRAAEAERPGDQRQQHEGRHRRRHDQAACQAELADRQEQERHADNGADARAHDGKRHRAALMALEPRRHGRGDAGGRERRPADADQHEAGIELPRRRDLADQRHAQAHRDGAQRQHRPRAPAVDAAADRALHQRAHQEEQGDGRGHLGDRPAVRGGHRLQVDARAEQAERPGEGCDDEAGRDDPPTVEHPLNSA